MRILRDNEPPGRNPQITAPIPNRDHSVSQQVATLLAAANSIAVVLASVRDGERGHGGSKDGGVLSSAEASLIGICSRLDSIVADSKNWSNKRLGKLEAQLSILYSRHIAFLEEQTTAAQKAAAPHMRLSPVLVRVSPTHWAAVLGDLDTPNGIYGVGATVEAALESFDKMARGEPCAEKEEWIQKQNEHTKKALDPKRDRVSEGTPADSHDGGTCTVAQSVNKIRRAKARKDARGRRNRKVTSHRTGNPGGA